MTTESRFREYLGKEKSLRPQSVYQYTYLINKIQQFLKKPLTEFTHYHDVREAILNFSKFQGYSTPMRYKVAKVIQVFYRWAAREGIIEHNPFVVSEFRKGHPKPPEWFEDETSVLRLIFNPQNRLIDVTMMLILFDCGIRRKELLDLKTEDIDFKNRIITIREGKGGRPRIAPFSELCQAVLLLYMYSLKQNTDDPILFPGPKWSRMNENQLTKHLQKIGNNPTPKRPKMHVYPHKFRHSVGYRLIDNGADMSIVQKILGHQNLNTTSQYIHFSKKRLIKHFDKYRKAG